MSPKQYRPEASSASIKTTSRMRSLHRSENHVSKDLMHTSRHRIAWRHSMPCSSGMDARNIFKSTQLNMRHFTTVSTKSVALAARTEKTFTHENKRELAGDELSAAHLLHSSRNSGPYQDAGKNLETGMPHSLPKGLMVWKSGGNTVDRRRLPAYLTAQTAGI